MKACVMTSRGVRLNLMTWVERGGHESLVCIPYFNVYCECVHYK